MEFLANLKKYFKILEYFRNYAYFFSDKFEKCNIRKVRKNILQLIAFDLIFHLVYIFMSFGHVVYCKIDAKNIFPHFLTIFALFKL